MRRRAKIAATLGPACDDPKVLGRMLRAGLDVARLNFSHGGVDDHRQRVERLRQLAANHERRCALLADLQGPRFRVGRLGAGKLALVEGQSIVLVAGTESVATKGHIPVPYAALAQDVRVGERVLIDDGKIELRVESIAESCVTCEVIRGGAVSNNKGINLPGSRLSAPALTAKDRDDLKTAVELGADWLAISFVRSADDIELARELLSTAGSSMSVMAKIERPEAIERLDSILEAADGLLVARGDLGVELPPEQVPIIQKQIVELANRHGKPVMTATQMLDSMRHSPRPTRAEASDVANAILDGSGSVLLTAETAVGQYPVEAIQMMERIIVQAERSGRVHRVPLPSGSLSVPMTAALAGCRAAHDVGAKYLVVFTRSGFTARQAARFRPSTPILVFTPEADVCGQLQMYWGVEPRMMEDQRSIEALVEALDRSLLEQDLVQLDDIVVVLSGSKMNVSGTTNLMELHSVGQDQ